MGTDLFTKKQDPAPAPDAVPTLDSGDSMGVQMLADPLVDPLQASSVMNGGSAPVQLEVTDPATECGNYKERYADPAPYNWSISYKVTVPGAGRGSRAGKGKRSVEARFDHATMNKSNKNPKVSMLMGTLITTDKEGRAEPIVEKEELMVSVAENTTRFNEALANASRFAKSKPKIKKPKTSREADIEKCY